LRRHVYRQAARRVLDIRGFFFHLDILRRGTALCCLDDVSANSVPFSYSVLYGRTTTRVIQLRSATAGVLQRDGGPRHAWVRSFPRLRDHRCTGTTWRQRTHEQFAGKRRAPGPTAGSARTGGWRRWLGSEGCEWRGVIRGLARERGTRARWGELIVKLVL
jgi:hypothetical protein